MEKNVLVFGSYVTDLCARTAQMPQPGQTVKGLQFRQGPGGKGSNQAVAAKRAGCGVSFATKLGRDSRGAEALEFYRAEGINTDCVLLDETTETGAAMILVEEESAQNQIVVVSGACGNITAGDMEPILRQAEQADIVLTQLETNLAPVYEVLQRAKAHDALTVLNPAPATAIEPGYFAYVDIVTPNETEAAFYTGIEVRDEASAKAAAAKLLALGVKQVVITMGALGCYATDGQTERFTGIVDCGPPLDSTGAGDAFNGGMACALAQGMEFYDAVLYGSVVAGLAVTRPGTAPAMPYKAEVDAIYHAL